MEHLNAKQAILEQKALCYTSFTSPLGWVIAAASERGLCLLGMGDDEAVLEAELHSAYPQVSLRHDAAALTEVTAVVTAYLHGEGSCTNLPLDAQGTPFQQRVWTALQAIPYGATRSYAQLAEDLGLARGAARAIGGACAANPVALVIPCHRAVGSDGKLHGFRWAVERKQRLLALERTALETVSG